MIEAPPDPGVRLALHQGQAAVFRSRARFRVVVAGRRWGKTQLARAELISRALQQPGRYWYVAPTKVDAKDMFWADLKAAVDPTWLVEKNETEMRLGLRNGAELRLMGADEPDSLRGRGLRFVVLDEFADMKAQAWSEVLRPALSDFKAPALFIGTPKSFNHFYRMYEKGQDETRPTWQSWQFRTVDNPFIDPEEVEAAKDDQDARTWRQEYEASFETVSGRAYYAFNRHHHVGAVLLDRQRPVCLFFDFNVDPACGGIGQRHGDRAEVSYVVTLTHRGGEATKSVALALRDRLRQQGHIGEVRIYGDATGKSAKTTGPADHQVIRDVFPGAVWCIPHANPHEKDRVAAMNSICESMSGVRRLRVSDTSCAPLIADLEQVVYAENGELDKKTDPTLTHISDACGYWIVRDFPVLSMGRAGEARVDWLL